VTYKKKTKKLGKSVLARLVLIVTFEELPDTAEIESLVESARCLGTIEQADLTYHSPATKSFRD
jgi:predicted nucleotidyltransferase